MAMARAAHHLASFEKRHASHRGYHAGDLLASGDNSANRGPQAEELFKIDSLDNVEKLVAGVVLETSQPGGDAPKSRTP